MSYKCDKCNKLRNGSELRRVDEIRNVVYTRNFMRFDRKTKNNIATYDTSFNGQEQVRVEKLCEECYDKFKDVPPKVNGNSEPKTVQFVGARKSFVKDNPRDTKNTNNLDLNGLKEKLERRK